MRRNESGFTLVEMLVTIAIGSLVTLAATTVLLLGLRINNRSTQTVIRQNTARVVITMLENLAQQDEIVAVESDTVGWAIKGEDNLALAKYVAADNAIYAGGSSAAILENVLAAHVTVNNNKVLTFSLETEDGSYSSAVYCRTLQLPSNETENNNPNLEETAIDNGTKEETLAEGRKVFLEVLTSQHRLIDGSPNPGLILAEDKRSTGTYYSEWYVGGYDEVTKPGWNAKTPWCACFVSWGISQNNAKLANDKLVKTYINDTNLQDGGIAYASVDNFANYFESVGRFKASEARFGEYTPIPGDVIFIDWDGSRGGYDPAHVGVVLTIETIEGTDYVYTIEGNSADMVAVCRYAIDDPIIMGYGILNWK